MKIEVLRVMRSLPGPKLGREDGLRYRGVVHVGLGWSSSEVCARLSPLTLLRLVPLTPLLLHLAGDHGWEADVAPVSLTAGSHLSSIHY